MVKAGIEGKSSGRDTENDILYKRGTEGGPR
jgi:hypothetical protein